MHKYTSNHKAPHLSTINAQLCFHSGKDSFMEEDDDNFSNKIKYTFNINII